MTKTKQKRAVSDNFEKKLMRYAIAGTTILALPAISQANIPGITQSGTITATGTGQADGAELLIYFDNAAVPDFALVALTGTDSNNPFATAGVLANTGDAFIGPSGTPPVYPGLFPTAFATAGAVTGSPTGLKVGSLAKSGKFPGYPGNFSQNGGDQFLGVIFTIGNGYHIGDIELSVTESLVGPTSTITLLSTSYDPVPFAFTPEPSFLPLYALGAAGLALARKRRNAARGAAN